MRGWEAWLLFIHPKHARNIHQKSYKIKTQANAGYIEIVEASIFNEKKIRGLFENADICINLVGILFEKGSNSFTNIHEKFPSIIWDEKSTDEMALNLCLERTLVSVVQACRCKGKNQKEQI